MAREGQDRRGTGVSLTSPEVVFLACLLQSGALFFVWEAALCGWGVSEGCFMQMAYEGHARMSETTSAWVMMILGIVGLGVSGVYWVYVCRRFRSYVGAARATGRERRRRRLQGSDAGERDVQRQGLLPARGPERPSTPRLRSPPGSPSFDSSNPLVEYATSRSPRQTRRSAQRSASEVAVELEESPRRHRQDGSGTEVALELQETPRRVRERFTPPIEVVVGGYGTDSDHEEVDDRDASGVGL